MSQVRNNNLQIIKDYQKAVWDDKNIQAIDRFFDTKALIHSSISSTQGTDEMKKIILKWYSAFPDLKVLWDDFICDENKVVSRWHAVGQHQEEFLGVKPTSKVINYTGVTIYQLKNEKIQEYWSFVDIHGILKQMSVK